MSNSFASLWYSVSYLLVLYYTMHYTFNNKFLRNPLYCLLDIVLIKFSDKYSKESMRDKVNQNLKILRLMKLWQYIFEKWWWCRSNNLTDVLITVFCSNGAIYSFYSPFKARMLSISSSRLFSLFFSNIPTKYLLQTNMKVDTCRFIFLIDCICTNKLHQRMNYVSKGFPSLQNKPVRTRMNILQVLL